MTAAAMPPCMRTCPAFASARGRKGDVIGYVGNTGDVRGANGGYHLHLELRINGTRTDPLQYIPH